MNKIFSLDTLDYVPVSFGNGYLFDAYESVITYLRGRVNQDDLDRMLKPVKSSGDNLINWYSTADGTYRRLQDLDENLSSKYKEGLHQFIDRMKRVYEPLLRSKDTDNKEWGQLLSTMFDPENLIVIGSDRDWALLWGWNFKNREENKLPIISPVTKIDDDGGTKAIDHYGNAVEGVGEIRELNPEPTPEPEPEPYPEPEPEPDPEPLPPEPIPLYDKSKNVGCIGRIVRILRWISYRFWGLFWLIIYTLLVLWLSRYCNRPNCDAYCQKLKETKKELELLEKRVKERCDTTYVSK